MKSGVLLPLLGLCLLPSAEAVATLTLHVDSSRQVITIDGVDAGATFDSSLIRWRLPNTLNLNPLRSIDVLPLVRAHPDPLSEATLLVDADYIELRLKHSVTTTAVAVEGTAGRVHYGNLTPSQRSLLEGAVGSTLFPMFMDWPPHKNPDWGPVHIAGPAIPAETSSWGKVKELYR